MEFEWDPAKAAINRRKHGVSFDEAAEAVLDTRALEAFDEVHSSNAENRYRRIGMSSRGRLLTVVVTERNGGTRIISACRSSRAEARAYAEAHS